MQLNYYQELAARTDSDQREHKDRLAYGALALAGEAGELVENVKHFLYHGHAFDKANFIEELGDLLWYVAYNARTVGLTLDDVAEANLAKLRRRYEHGYSNAASIARVDKNKPEVYRGCKAVDHSICAAWPKPCPCPAVQ